MAVTLLVVSAEVLGVGRVVREGNGHVFVHPPELGDRSGHHRKLIQSLHRGVNQPEHRV